MNNILRILLPLACVLALAGCGSSPDITVSGTTSISKGKQLEDLQRALNEEAITQSEYDRLRSRILKQPG